MRYVCLFALAAALLPAQDGAAIYQERCARCHDTAAPRVPSLSTIKGMSGEAVYTALTSGVMKRQAEGLSSAELFALIRFLGPSGGSQAGSVSDVARTCKEEAKSEAGKAMGRWDGWGNSLTNARFQDGNSAQVSAADVSKLKLKWAFNLGEVAEARSQPTVAGGMCISAQ